MGKTLLELFQSQALSSGKTAQEEFAVRNSKDIRVGASSYPLIDNTGFALARTVRKTDALTALKRETLIEEEVTGVRIIRAASAPVLYGTDLIRVTTQSTPMVTEMKDSIGGVDSGLLGGAISKGREKFTNGLSKLGIKLPQTLIPTRVLNAEDEAGTKFFGSTGATQDTMINLGKIKDGGQGNPAGKFLKQSAKGTPKQIGGQVVGNAIKAGKNQVRGALFGDRSTAANEVTTFNGKKIATLLDTRSTTIFNTSNGRFTGKYVSYNYGSKDFADNIIITSVETGETDSDGWVDIGGVRYSKTILRNFDTESGFKKLDEMRDDGGMVSKIPALILPADNVERGTKIQYSKAFDRSDRELYLNAGTRKPSKIKSKVNDTLTSKVFAEGNKNIDKYGVYDGETLPNGLKEEDVDFIPFKFYSIAQNKTVQFRATVTGVTETLTPSWESANFVGNPFKYYTYGGVERSVQLSFKVYSLSIVEHNKMWEKLNFLAYQTYPQNYIGGLGMVPPIIKFTLGDMYVKKVGFIESLSFTQDDNAGWEIGMGGDSPLEKSSKTTKLPRIIEVSTTIKFIENKAETFNRNLYGYKGVE